MWINKFIDSMYITYYDIENNRIYYTYNNHKPKFDLHCDLNKDYLIYSYLIKKLKLNYKQLALSL